MNDYVLLGIMFLLFTILLKIVLSAIFEKGRMERRIKKYIPSMDNEIKQNVKEEQIEKKSFIKDLSLWIESVLQLKNYDLLLIQSNVKLSKGELFLARVVAAILSAMIGYFYSLHFLVLILLAIIGYHLPMFYLKRKRKKRLQKASDQLAEALGTMANSLRAGSSFMQAMNLVAKEIGDPLGTEFSQTLKDMNYGVSMEDAFEGLLERLPDKELEIVLNTLLIQRTSGGNLAYLLEALQETIIDRSRVKGEVRTLTSQGRMSSVIITGLPIALFLYINLVDPDYIQKLFSHPVGWIMMIVGGINIIIGWLFIRKIINIEV